MKFQFYSLLVGLMLAFPHQATADQPYELRLNKVGSNTVYSIQDNVVPKEKLADLFLKGFQGKDADLVVIVGDGIGFKELDETFSLLSKSGIETFTLMGTKGRGAYEMKVNRTIVFLDEENLPDLEDEPKKKVPDPFFGWPPEK